MTPVRFIFAILSMLLITLVLIAGLYFYRAANRYFADGTLLIYGRFYAADVEDIKIIFPNAAISRRSQSLITRGDNQILSPVIFCDAEYFTIHFMEFIEGGPWHENENTFPLIILNEALAWYLFGGFDVTGLTVRIDEKFYQIVGIVRQGDRPMAWLSTAWLPLLIYQNPNISITSLYVRQSPYNPVDGPANARYLLERRLFRSAIDYTIIDINRYVESIAMRYRILVYGIWLYILILLIKAATKHHGMTKKAIPLYLGAVICIAILTGINDILIWLPTLAESNISVFSGLSNAETIPPERYLSYGLQRVSQINRYANFIWIVGAAGLFSLIIQPKL